jgi:predicted secreted protein
VSAAFPGFWVGVVIAYWNGCSVSQPICCEDGEWLGLRMSSPSTSCGGDGPSGETMNSPAQETAEPEPTRTGQTTEPTPLESSTPRQDSDMTTSPGPAPLVVTQADDGRLISLTVGAEVPLRLESSWAWDQPAIDGDAVGLTQVDYFADPGFMEWIVTAVRPGDAAVTATGAPNCGDDSRCPPMEVRIGFRITG